MNASERLIADTLRDIAAEAPAPRPMADAVWQAGRRRRWGGLAAAGTAGAGAIAAAIALPLALAGSPGQSPGILTGPTLPVSLAKPIEFQEVAAVHDGRRCPAGRDWLPGNGACFRVTGARMTVTELRSAQVVESRGGIYSLAIRLTGRDVRRFAVLTSQVCSQPSPRNQLAIIMSGVVFAHPTVQMPITTGQALINAGYTSRGGPEGILHHLGYRPPVSGG